MAPGQDQLKITTTKKLFQYFITKAVDCVVDTLTDINLSYPPRALPRRHNDRSVGLFYLHVSLFLVLGTNQVGGVPGLIKGQDMRGSSKKKPKEEIPIVQWFQ